MTPVRARDLGIRIGNLPAGPLNAITDVAHVAVGHSTVRRDEPDPPDGRGIARTGVTAIVPFDLASLAMAPAPAGMAALNGAGELTGSLSIREWGLIETPILLTGTMAVGRVFDAVVELVVEAQEEEVVVIPVVGECDDSALSYPGVVQVSAGDVRTAVHGATTEAVTEGAVGAGTGMVSFGWKGGIGTASRVVGDWTVGVLTLCNFGTADRLTIGGLPFGRTVTPESYATEDSGSCIVVVATDAPLLSHQLERLARRAGLGLARVGSIGGHGSGEIFVAFSTGLRVGHERGGTVDVRIVRDAGLSRLFEGVVDATEEAVLNALVTSETTTGRAGRTFHRVPVDAIASLIAFHKFGS